MAQPILASTLFRLAKEHRASTGHDMIVTGFNDIDNILQGGIKKGRITCISGERGTGKTLIALHILVTHVLSHATSQAAIIDTTGIFDVQRLHQIIIARLKVGQLAQRAPAASNLNPHILTEYDAINDLETSASQALDRIKIMRVFDFVGLSEAVNELRDEVRTAEKDEDLAAAWEAEPTQKLHIADSPEQECDEDIMLFDGANEDVVRPDAVSLIVVDNITSVVNPILKTDYVQGQALLTTFIRSLSLVTTEMNLATLLLNNAASPRQPHQSFPGLANLNRDANQPPSTYNSDPLTASLSSSLLNQPSIFSSTTVHPSLGKTFATLLDCQILLSTVPQRRVDAEIVVGGKSGRAATVNVIEVLSARAGSSSGSWAAFEVWNSGVGLRVPL